jgi:hypothetical protein
MNTASRLGAYGAGLAVVFGGAFVAADAVVPRSAVDSWTLSAKTHGMDGAVAPGHGAQERHGGHSDRAAQEGTGTGLPGLTSARRGYLLSPVAAPEAVAENGELSFVVLGPRGDAVTEFATSHEKKMHLIVVRTDGTGFRHVHPTMDAQGTWSLPWEWPAAGTYRVYADFAVAGDEHQTLTLTRTVEVAGDLTPVAASPNDVATVDGFTVKVRGDLVAGASSRLTFTVSRAGKPVTTVQPYLGAFGHLVALREGDLAYLHAHPEGVEPATGQTSGPEIAFAVEAPTPGRYLLYLDFRVGGEVHSAAFVVDTEAGATSATGHDHPGAGSTAESDDGHGY